MHDSLTHTKPLLFLTLLQFFFFLSNSRERNRMHAKLTRDRKKCFIAVLEKTIGDLQADIERMKGVLTQVSTTTATTPALSPELTPMADPPCCCSKLDNDDENKSERPNKRMRHGFVLGD